MAKRVFFAINLPDKVKTALGGVGEKLAQRSRRRNIRWVATENLHVTLHFLGNKTDEEISRLDDRAKVIIKNLAPFELVTTKVGCFPNERRPRVIIVETSDASNRAHTLAKKLGEAILGLGMEIDLRPWHSHITLGRVKDASGVCDIDMPVSALTIPVKSFELMESRLEADGVIYSIISSYPLMVNG